MESILSDNMINTIMLGGNPFENDDVEEKYAMYFKEGDEYIPSVKLKTVKKIPSGVYKALWKQNDWHITPVPISTDELYSFENDLTSKMLEETQLFWDKMDIYKKYKIAHKRGLLLVGGAGNGKSSVITMLINQIVQKNGLVFIANSAQEFVNLTEVLPVVIRQVEPDRPIITIIEDVDQMVKTLNGDSQLLDFLDGKTAINHHLVILTSNDTTDLSAALLRPSRIDMCIEVLPPSENVRYEYFKKKGIEEEKLDDYVAKTEDLSFAELKEVFIGTQILGKDLDKVIEQITDPYECKDYLNKTTEMKGID